MYNLISIKEIIRIYNLKIKKSLGQNFLIDEDIANEIIKNAEIKEDDYILEIGPGLGSLSKIIATKTKYFVAVEVDKSIIEPLRSIVKPIGQIEIINEDILRIQNIKTLFQKYFCDFKAPLKVIANVPYYITKPIIMLLLKNYEYIDKIIIMVQKELGERIISKESTKNYGVLSIICQYYGLCEKVIDVCSSSFYPEPVVDSVVLSIDIKNKRDLEPEEEEWFLKIIKSSFKQRRKILLNSLSSLFDKDKKKVKFILNKCNIDENRRAETLKIEEFKILAKSINIIK